MHSATIIISFTANNKYQALPLFRFFQLPLSFPGDISAPFILSNRDDDEDLGVDKELDASFLFAAPLILNPPTGTSSRSIVSCLDVGATGCLLRSLRLLDGITVVGCVEEPFVSANRLSNEGGPSALPSLFLVLFGDRGDSSATLARLVDVLGPANIALWAPRIAIPDAGGVGLASVRSARGRVGACNPLGGVLSAGRAGRECGRASSCGLLVAAPLLLLELLVSVAGGLLVTLAGTSSLMIF